MSIVHHQRSGKREWSQSVEKMQENDRFMSCSTTLYRSLFEYLLLFFLRTFFVVLSTFLTCSVCSILLFLLLLSDFRMSTRAAFESLGSNQNFERRGFQRWLVEVDTQSARVSFMCFFLGGGGNDAVGAGPSCLLPRLLLNKYQGKH